MVEQVEGARKERDSLMVLLAFIGEMWSAMGATFWALLTNVRTIYYLQYRHCTGMSIPVQITLLALVESKRTK